MVESYSLQRFMHLWRKGELSGAVRVGGRYGLTPTGSAYLESGPFRLQIPEVPEWQPGDLVSGFISLEQFHSNDIDPAVAIGRVAEVSAPIRHHRPRETSSLRAENDLGSQAKSVWSMKRKGPTLLRQTPEEVQAWSDFLWVTREFFHNQGFLEATTPSLVVNPGMEPELEPFATVWRQGSHSTTVFLPTSPELGLKKLMVQGWTDVFELKTVYRNEESTPIHEPEFMMLEWYRGFADLQAIEGDLRGLILCLAQKVFRQDLSNFSIEKKTVRQLWAEHTSYELKPSTTKDELFRWATGFKLNPPAHYGWNDLFHLLWVAKVEEHLPRAPFLLCDYPPSQAALAQLNSEGWADRFEFFWGGMEIANAFHELTDPSEQRLRFLRDQRLRKEYGRTELPIDEEFMAALEYGLPPSGGIALGMDRLFKILWEWFR